MAHQKLSEEEAGKPEEYINQTFYQLIMQKHLLRPEQFDIDPRDENLWEIILERANKIKMEYVAMRRNPKIQFRDQRLRDLFHRFVCLVAGFYQEEWQVVYPNVPGYKNRKERREEMKAAKKRRIEKWEQEKEGRKYVDN